MHQRNGFPEKQRLSDMGRPQPAKSAHGWTTGEAYLGVFVEGTLLGGAVLPTLGMVATNTKFFA